MLPLDVDSPRRPSSAGVRRSWSLAHAMELEDPVGAAGAPMRVRRRCAACCAACYSRCSVS